MFEEENPYIIYNNYKSFRKAVTRSKTPITKPLASIGKSVKTHVNTHDLLNKPDTKQFDLIYGPNDNISKDLNTIHVLNWNPNTLDNRLIPMLRLCIKGQAKLAICSSIIDDQNWLNYLNFAATEMGYSAATFKNGDHCTGYNPASGKIDLQYIEVIANVKTSSLDNVKLHREYSTSEELKEYKKLSTFRRNSKQLIPNYANAISHRFDGGIMFSVVNPYFVSKKTSINTIHVVFDKPVDYKMMYSKLFSLLPDVVQGTVQLAVGFLHMNVRYNTPHIELYMWLKNQNFCYKNRLYSLKLAQYSESVQLPFNSSPRWSYYPVQLVRGPNIKSIKYI